MTTKFPEIKTAQEFIFHFKDKFWLEAAALICRRHKIVFQVLRRSEHGENVVFLVDDSFVIKIFTPFRNGFERESEALALARGKTSLPVPEIFFAGEIENFKYFVTTQFSGDSITRDVWLALKKKDQTKILSQLANGLKELHSHAAPTKNFDWRKFVEYQANTTIERQKSSGANAEWLANLPEFLNTNLKLLPLDSAPSFMHGDVHFGNLRLAKKDGRLQISGLFDFADSLSGFYEYEFVAVGVLMIQGQGELQREFFRAYGYKEEELNENLRARLMLLTILYECSSLRKYALRLKPEAIDFTLAELERAIWNFV
ncbi:MAG: aminoglycoside phosphotransferase family protein [Acidobacteriota bacterium]|nr:aminoglycoside phosphotransferase family protein [Acidobacteriota bacterium]